MPWSQRSCLPRPERVLLLLMPTVLRRRTKTGALWAVLLRIRLLPRMAKATRTLQRQRKYRRTCGQGLEQDLARRMPGLATHHGSPLQDWILNPHLRSITQVCLFQYPSDPNSFFHFQVDVSSRH